MANFMAKEVGRSEAFIRAWAVAKQGIIERVVGVTHDGRQRMLEELDRYSKTDIQIQLEHELNNPFDKNAVIVLANVRGEKHKMRVGYIDRRNAIIWASLLDKGVMIGSALQGIVGGFDRNYGMRIRIMV